MKPFRHLAPILTGGVCLAVIGFYYWTVGAPRMFDGQQRDYYNLLVDGFQEGSLAMKVQPEAGGQMPFLMDASLYRGKYHLYFGVTPVLVLLWPWAAMTGQDLPEDLAAAFFAAAAFLTSVGWLVTLRRRFLPETGLVPWLLAVVMLGLAVPYPVTLSHPLFYEIAILSGLTFSFAGLWCLTLALLRPGRAAAWLAAGSLCAGLAAGSRPTLIPGAVLAVVLTFGLLAWRERKQGGGPAWGRWLRLAAAGAGPVAACGLGLAWYNRARFDSPLDFGLLHQQGANANGFPFTLEFLWKNLNFYYLTPPDFSWFFPFFMPGPKPYGSYQEQVHGQIYTLPVFLLAAAHGISRWRRTVVMDSGPGQVLAVAGMWSAGACIFVGMAWAHANRYLLDFHGVFILLTMFGLLACTRAAAWWRHAAWAGLAWCLVVVSFNVCASFHVHGFWRGTRPVQYERVAAMADRLVWPLHRLTGPRLGGMELAVRFPAGTPGALEPLVVAGGGPDKDAIIVKYTTPGRARLVFMHLGRGEVEGDEFELRPERVRWLKVHLGSLYPPPWHPWYKQQPAGLARAVNRVAVTLDGASILDRDVVCYQASANQVSLGRRNGFPIGHEQFSGTVARVRGLHGDQEWLLRMQAAKGSVRLRLLLPRDRFGAEEPLLLTGRRWGVDLVSITYVREGVVRFSILHEGWPEIMRSPEVTCDYSRPLDVIISLGSLAPSDGWEHEPEAGATIEMEGKIVLARRFRPHPTDPLEVHVGSTPWQVADCRSMFGGWILEQTRVREDQAPLRRARYALLAGGPVTLECTLPGEGVWPNQPLVTTGITGRGDSLFLEQVEAGRARVGFDHWGWLPRYSEPFDLVPGARHRFTVSFGARVSPEETRPGQLRVLLDGKTLFDLPVELFQTTTDQVYFGGNPIGMSTSQPSLTGELRVIEEEMAGLPGAGVTSP